MEKHGSRIFLAFVLLVFSSIAASAQSLTPSSKWKSASNEILEVRSVNGTKWDGLYINPLPWLARINCKANAYPVSGSLAPQGIIFFVVDLTDCARKMTFAGPLWPTAIITKWTVNPGSGSSGHTRFDKL
jgi:hypothetical protein